MTGEEVETLVAKTLGDEAFARRLIADPAAAARELGLSLDDETAAALRGMTLAEVHAFAEEYRSATDPDQRRAAC